MQKILFPMPTMNITQGYGTGSHKGTFAIDCAGEDAGIDFATAPVTGTIKKKWENGHSVWLESTEPVQFADGYQGYATFCFTHDNNITDLTVGQVIQQGQRFYEEGTAGNASGNHIHLEAAKGKFTGSGWYQNAYGIWTLNNSCAPQDAYFLDNVRVINGGGYNWKTTQQGDEEMKVPDQDNFYWRIGQDLALRIRGRQLSREEFRTYLVGQDTLRAIEILSDDPEATAVQHWQDVGQTAVRDKWDEQIYGLQDQVKALQAQLAEKPKEVIVEKPVEVIKEVPVEKTVTVEVVKGDDERSLGDLLSAAFKKLLKVK